MPSQGGSYGIVASFDGGLSWIVAGTARLIETGSATMQRTAKRVDSVNSAGSTQNVTFWDFGKSIQVQCYPRGSTLANAAAVNVVDVKPGTIVKLYTLAASDQEDTVLAANSSDSGATGGTTYFVAAFSKVHEAQNKVRWDMTLELFDDMTVAAIT